MNCYVFKRVNDFTFFEEIKAGNPLAINNPEMTQFLMNLDETVELYVLILAM